MCWGANPAGQLGLGHSKDRGSSSHNTGVAQSTLWQGCAGTPNRTDWLLIGAIIGAVLLCTRIVTAAPEYLAWRDRRKTRLAAEAAEAAAKRRARIETAARAKEARTQAAAKTLLTKQAHQAKQRQLEADQALAAENAKRAEQAHQATLAEALAAEMRHQEVLQASEEAWVFAECPQKAAEELHVARKREEVARCEAAEALSAHKLAAAARDKFAEELAKEELRRRCQGISVDFLVSKFDAELRVTLGSEYTEATTFVDLERMMWGVRGNRFKNTVDFFGHASMTNWDREGQAGVSLCTAIASQFPDAVGDATHFISWTWRYPVKKFIRTLQEHCGEHQLDTKKTFVWVCFFCNDQFDWLSGGGNDGVEAFGNVLKHIGKVICVVDDHVASKAIYFGRIWTVFEVFTASIEKIDVDLALMADARRRLLQTPVGQVAQAIEVDVMTAQATDPDDEQRIKQLIAGEDGAATTTNTTVKQLFVKLITSVLMG